MTTREAVIKAVAVLTTAFNRESSETLTEAYLLALSDLSADEVAAAMKRAMVECRFMPVPSELRAFSRPPRDMARDIALAWEAVRRAVDAHDYTKSVDFGPLVNAVVRNLGGWQALCASTVPDLVWRRKDFERVYATFAAADPLTLHGGPLRGAFDGPILVVEIEGQPSRARAARGVERDAGGGAGPRAGARRRQERREGARHAGAAVGHPATPVEAQGAADDSRRGRGPESGDSRPGRGARDGG